MSKQNENHAIEQLAGIIQAVLNDEKFWPAGLPSIDRTADQKPVVNFPIANAHNALHRLYQLISDRSQQHLEWVRLKLISEHVESYNPTDCVTIGVLRKQGWTFHESWLDTDWVRKSAIVRRPSRSEEALERAEKDWTYSLPEELQLTDIIFRSGYSGL